MSDEVIEALKQVPLFRGMSDKALAGVAEMLKESHPCRQDHPRRRSLSRWGSI